MMKSALLFRLGGLGDLFVTLPAIQFIRRKFPRASLTLACREEYGMLLHRTGVVNRVIRGEGQKLSPLFSEAFYPGQELGRWLQGYDLIIGWMQDKRNRLLERNLMSVHPQGCYFFYYEPENRESISRSFYRKTAAVLEAGRKIAFPFEECSKLPKPCGRKKEVCKLVVIHPGSGSEKKCWPIQKFLAIVQRLGQKGMRGVLVTGNAEERIKKIIEETSLPLGWDWLRSPALIALSRLLREAVLYLGNDSGVTHLAAACGTEVVALFRSDLEAMWRPYGRVHTLSAVSVEKIAVEEVWGKIGGLLDLA